MILGEDNICPLFVSPGLYLTRAGVVIFPSEKWGRLFLWEKNEKFGFL
jgi:hypothetical protein